MKRPNLKAMATLFALAMTESMTGVRSPYSERDTEGKSDYSLDAQRLKLKKAEEKRKRRSSR